MTTFDTKLPYEKYIGFILTRGGGYEQYISYVNLVLKGIPIFYRNMKINPVNNKIEHVTKMGSSRRRAKVPLYLINQTLQSIRSLKFIM